MATEEVSLGDFVLTGGEVAALAVIEATVRLLPGALGDEGSAEADSFADGLLDYPHYTRPAQRARAGACPRCCSRATTSGIRRWRRKEALRATRDAAAGPAATRAALTAEDRAPAARDRGRETTVPGVNVPSAR